MATSLSASPIPSLNAREPKDLCACSSKSVFSSSARFPLQIRRFPIGQKRISSSSRPRYVPLAIEAKKQTYNSFDDLLANSEKPLLVDFYATWCGPCQFMVPILNEASAALSDMIHVVKIDTEKYPSIANKYKIEALPTFIIFKDGRPCDRFEGALTANQLIQRIKNSLDLEK